MEWDLQTKISHLPIWGLLNFACGLLGKLLKGTPYGEVLVGQTGTGWLVDGQAEKRAERI